MGSVVIPENIIKNHICQYLKLQGIFCWVNVSTGIYDPTLKRFRKLTGFQIKGSSDILGVLHGGRMIAIECKNKNGVVTKEQQFFLDEVNRMGGLGFVARSVDDVVEQLSRL